MKSNPYLDKAFKQGNLELLCIATSANDEFTKRENADIPFVKGNTYSILEVQNFINDKNRDRGKVWSINTQSGFFCHDHDYVKDFAEQHNIPLEDFDNVLELIWWHSDKNDEIVYSPAFFMYIKKLSFNEVLANVMKLDNANLWALKVDIEDEIKRRFCNQ